MPPKPISKNTLFYGDNLPILREHLADESVDLVYLDPPFNSNRSYNVLFKDESGKAADAQITAFDDTWHWSGSTPATYHELVTEGPSQVAGMIAALYQAIGPSQMMAYLVMMVARLVELHRVLKPTGSLYLHCDPTASHYLKVVLDTIFGSRNFQAEIVWKRSSAHSDVQQGSKQHGHIHDNLFFYTKSKDWVWNPVFVPYDEEYLEQEYRHQNQSGRRYKETDMTAAKPGGDTLFGWSVKRPDVDGARWEADLDEEYKRPKPGWQYKSVKPYEGRYWAYSRLNMISFAREGRLIHRSTGMPRLMQFADEMPGVPLQDLWTDIPPIGAQAAERLGYPTQKPLALLERILQASSNPGDVVLDPFCGCGTTVAAAEKLGRRWIGIDITHLSIALQKYRLREMFPDAEFDVVGEPQDLGSARQLAQDDRFQFQWWALSLIRARPVGGEAGSKKGKKGADQGIDGVITFIDDASGKPKRVIVQVKSGGVGSQTIRDLRGTVEREQAAIGVLLTLEPATKPMEIEVGSAGFYESSGWGQKYPRIQILTIEQLLKGVEIAMPPTSITFKQAQQVKRQGGTQGELDLGA